MTIYLGKREVRLMQLGAGHTSGDIVAWVPDAEVMFSGDLIEYHSACYCGDAHAARMAADAERNPRLQSEGDRAGPRRCARRALATVREAIAMTRDFVTLALWRGRDCRSPRGAR